jgi:hypothetical protein
VGYYFVENTDTIQSEQDTQDPPNVAQRMQSGIDTWDGGIRVTGGALEPEKSFWYLISFFWDESVWRYTTVQETPSDISVRNHHGERIKLDRLEASESILTVGVETAPDGNSEEE